MVKDYDKPKYVDIKRNENDEHIINESIKIIKDLFRYQSFGVLATQGDCKCYTSLISFATSEDLKQIVFATPKNTKKYNSIKHNDNVSILVDNRSNNPDSINNIIAVTGLGNVKILKESSDIEKWSKILINKHSYLDSFTKADTTAIILVEVSKYYYVSSFQEVVEWDLNS